jgi:hypothetical protein
MYRLLRDGPNIRAVGHVLAVDPELGEPCPPGRGGEPAPLGDDPPANCEGGPRPEPRLGPSRARGDGGRPCRSWALQAPNGVQGGPGFNPGAPTQFSSPELAWDIPVGSEIPRRRVEEGDSRGGVASRSITAAKREVPQRGARAALVKELLCTGFSEWRRDTGGTLSPNYCRQKATRPQQSPPPKPLMAEELTCWEVLTSVA